MFKRRSIQWMAARLMGRRHWCTDWLATLLAADATLLDHILEQGQGYLHYLCLVNIGMPDALFNNADPAKLVAMIRRTSKRRLLNALYDPCPAGLAATLKRLAPRPLSQAGYRRLLRLLGEQDARLFMQHGNAISATQLWWLETLPRALWSCPLIRQIKDKEDMNKLQSMIKDIHYLSPGMSYAEIALSLRHTKLPRRQSSHDPHILTSWYEKQLKRKHFPDPPWPGNEWIKPISNGAELYQTARLMRNCIAKVPYLTMIINGQLYFYITRHRPYILMQMIKYCGKWELDQAEGAANEKLDAKRKSDILLILQNTGWPDLQAS